MSLSNQEIMKRIDAAIKQITVADLGNAVLQPEKAARFVREMERSNPLLAASRRLDMVADKRDIDRIAYQTQILDATAAETKPTFNTNRLDTVEPLGKFVINDDTLEDNIEGEALEDLIINLAGAQVGRDLVKLFLQGDTASGDTFLALTDGWLKLAASTVDGSGADFTQGDVEEAFNAAMGAMDAKYLESRNDLRFIVTFDIKDAYQDVLRTRGTPLGDQAQTGNSDIPYKSIMLLEAGQMATNKFLLASPNNLVWGVHREVRIEPDREPANRRTAFYISARIDANYEDENAAVEAINVL